MRRAGVEGRCGGQVWRGAAEGAAMRREVRESRISTSSMPRALHDVACPLKRQQHDTAA